MSGLVKELLSRDESLDFVSHVLSFPWKTRNYEVALENANRMLLAEDISANTPYPPYDRSLRDGYAVNSTDVSGASSSFPVYLNLDGKISMGEIPSADLLPGSAMEIYTGGILPEGADSVVMVEDTELSEKWLEVRSSVQNGDNILKMGEEVKKNQHLLKGGSLIDFCSIGVLATFGFRRIKVIDLKVGIISTGDEVVPVDKSPLPPGCIRDVNSWTLCSLLKDHGFNVKTYGIIPDKKNLLGSCISKAYSENDVVLISGGSSVSVRDFCSELIEDLPEPGLIVRGIQIRPGKPTLIGGSYEDKKLVIGLPGHPLSCSVVAYTIILPLLFRLISSRAMVPWKSLFLPLISDVHGKTGLEEFIPCHLDDSGRVIPKMAKSGYISAMYESSGLIRLSESVETVRKGEEVEVLLW